MEQLKVKITGIEPLLLNNPQTVDPFNKYARAAKLITAKRKKTDEDLYRLREIGIESKIYFDDVVGLYIPSTWITASIASQSWAKAKIKKADIRSCVFINQSKIKLNYTGMDKVKEKVDVVNNDQFHAVLNLKQGQVRVTKAAPIFHDWSFEFEVLFDDTIINESELKGLIEFGAKFGGYGDFRPTYGRSFATFE
ncbi:hypothetical protein HPQ32_14035 [Photobacterium carnosum]|uniref:hypothetical protein n=1 Tax=Photobacterium carnosum TaxID=2023717 RepID=UPI001C9160C6|nr:hypothetical protein [Photobacterium carnosum]MBY3789543.1 hypothetical protein [Photobacterium carnosum]MCD9534602.1 hypothetical protein [Photobacterium carnosum]